jgi:hypothetical protein
LFPRLDVSTFQRQLYNEKIELRSIKTDPTSLLQLTFYTIDTTVFKPKVLGYSFFPLFIDIEEKMPILQEDPRINVFNKKRTIHKGNYQMPIYWQAPKESKNMSYRDYIKLERIPTASVLLRVDYASIDHDSNFISFKDPDPAIRALAYEPPPNYNAGTYSTLYYIISEVEQEMYSVRRQRKIDVPIMEVLRELTKAMNSGATSEAEILKFFRAKFQTM